MFIQVKVINYSVVPIFFISLVAWPMKPVMHWSSVIQIIQIKLFLAQDSKPAGPRLLHDLQQQKDAHSACKSLGDTSQSC